MKEMENARETIGKKNKSDDIRDNMLCKLFLNGITRVAHSRRERERERIRYAYMSDVGSEGGGGATATTTTMEKEEKLKQKKENPVSFSR